MCGRALCLAGPGGAALLPLRRSPLATSRSAATHINTTAHTTTTAAMTSNTIITELCVVLFSYMFRYSFVYTNRGGFWKETFRLRVCRRRTEFYLLEHCRDIRSARHVRRRLRSAQWHRPLDDELPRWLRDPQVPGRPEEAYCRARCHRLITVCFATTVHNIGNLSQV
jgi:hypothetical protein